jgi:hypothetical protein
MKDTAAAFHDVPCLDRRKLGRCRRAIRLVVAGVGIGFGSAAVACALVAAGTVTAAWIVNTALANHPGLTTETLTGPAALALADHYPVLASAPEATGYVLASAEPASIDIASVQPPDTPTFAAKWAGTTAAATSTEAVRVMPVPIEPTRAVASLQPAIQAAPAVAAAAPEKRFTPLLPAHNKSTPLPEADGRTAVYDIAAHTVYLPNGIKLEAHSGLGDKLDDPRYVNLKDRGPTPPNVYDLTLREQLFHTVRALRLNPVGGDSMYGRDGILAHSYMLGANGQSNGCVSFKDYPAFLHAYLNGEIDRLVVVPRLGNTSWRTASAARGPVGRYADNNP